MHLPEPEYDLPLCLSKSNKEGNGDSIAAQDQDKWLNKKIPNQNCVNNPITASIASYCSNGTHTILFLQSYSDTLALYNLQPDRGKGHTGTSINNARSSTNIRFLISTIKNSNCQMDKNSGPITSLLSWNSCNHATSMQQNKLTNVHLFTECIHYP
jgi:hypothetical protein